MQFSNVYFPEIKYPSKVYVLTSFRNDYICQKKDSMFQAAVYTNRRKQLAEKLGSGLLVFPGNLDSPMNYKDNIYHFRQDSTFLYFFGVDMPGVNAIVNVDDNSTTLYGDDLTVDSIIWMGEHTKMQELAAKAGIEKVAPSSEFPKAIQAATSANQALHYLPPYRHEKKIRLAEYLGKTTAQIDAEVSQELIKAVIALRERKGPEEIAEMEKAVNISRAMHLLPMRQAAPGASEAVLAGMIQGTSIAAGGNLAYPIILSVDGQILHNHSHANIMKSGQLLLGDFGAETAMHYAGDITRTVPVDPGFSQQQKEIYQIVLDAENKSIEALKAGVTYKEIHLNAAKIIASGLSQLGIMKGDVDAAVEAGAHALFFPHGLGHQIGLDVHDMEDLGENLVGYDDTVQRSDQFGLAYLRLAKKLEAGFVLTVEPGIYFIPALIDQWKASNKHADFINYSALDPYLNFGGIRIEDNVLVTESGHQVLGKSIPKTIAEIETFRRGKS